MDADLTRPSVDGDGSPGSPVERVVWALAVRGRRPRRSGMGWTSLCPVHEDRHPSLSVREGDDGRALVRCHAGCEFRAIIAALGLKPGDLKRDDHQARQRRTMAGVDPLPSQAQLALWRRRLLGDEDVLGRLNQRRGWTLDALESLGLGLDGERLTIPVCDRDGRLVNVLHYAFAGGRDGRAKMLALRGRPRDLFPAPETICVDELWVVEGEPDAITARTLGLAAVAVPGANGWRDEWAGRFATRRVVVCGDCDRPGRRLAQRIAGSLSGLATEVRILDLDPSRDDGHDIGEFAQDAHNAEDRARARWLLCTAAASCEPVEPGPAVPQAGRYAGRRYAIEALLAQPDEPIPYRCEGIAADGYLTVLAGRGGEGKSWLALALARGVERGEAVAGIACRQGRAVIFDAENGPRLMARRLRAADVGPGAGIVLYDIAGLDLVRDLDYVRAVIVAERANLVVIDSLRVLTGGRAENEGDDMAPVIVAVKQLARDTASAIVLIHHRGKGAELYRGSSTILDQTDLLFSLGRITGDPHAPTRRRLEVAKFRIDAEPPDRWLTITADRTHGHVAIRETDPYTGQGDDDRPLSKREQYAHSAVHLIQRHGPLIAAELCRLLQLDTDSRSAHEGFKLAVAQGWLVRHDDRRYTLAPVVGSPDTTTDNPTARLSVGRVLKGNDRPTTGRRP